MSLTIGFGLYGAIKAGTNNQTNDKKLITENSENRTAGPTRPNKRLTKAKQPWCGLHHAATQLR